MGLRFKYLRISPRPLSKRGDRSNPCCYRWSNEIFAMDETTKSSSNSPLIANLTPFLHSPKVKQFYWSWVSSRIVLHPGIGQDPVTPVPPPVPSTFTSLVDFADEEISIFLSHIWELVTCYWMSLLFGAAASQRSSYRTLAAAFSLFGFFFFPKKMMRHASAA